jgi:hypothetical protein
LFSGKQWTVPFRCRHLPDTAGRKSSLLAVPSPGSRLFLYFPQESGACSENPLYVVLKVVKSNNLLENSHIKRGVVRLTNKFLVFGKNSEIIHKWGVPI